MDYFDSYIFNIIKRNNGFICGECHTIALMKDGSVYSWGWNDFGQLGIGNYEDQSLPCITPFYYFPHININDLSKSIHKWLFPLLLEEIESEKAVGKYFVSICSENGAELRFHESILRVRYEEYRLFYLLIWFYSILIFFDYT